MVLFKERVTSDLHTEEPIKFSEGRGHPRTQKGRTKALVPEPDSFSHAASFKHEVSRFQSQFTGECPSRWRAYMFNKLPSRFLGQKDESRNLKEIFRAQEAVILQAESEPGSEVRSNTDHTCFEMPGLREWEPSKIYGWGSDVIRAVLQVKTPGSGAKGRCDGQRL